MKSLSLTALAALAITGGLICTACASNTTKIHVANDFEDLLTPLPDPELTKDQLAKLGSVKVYHRTFADPTVVGARGRSATAFRSVLINESHANYVDLPLDELEHSEYLVPDGVMFTLLEALDKRGFLDESKSRVMKSKDSSPDEMVRRIPRRINKYIAIESKGTTYLIYRPREIPIDDDAKPHMLFNDCEALVMRAYNSQKLKAYKGTGNQNADLFREFREQGSGR